MAKTKFTWNMDALMQLRTDPQIQAMIQAAAEDIAARAGEDFIATPVEITGGNKKYGPRARAAVVASTQRAKRAEAEDHVLLKALG